MGKREHGQCKPGKPDEYLAADIDSVDLGNPELDLAQGTMEARYEARCGRY